MDRVEKTIILVTVLGLLLICGLSFFMVGCSDVPYSRPLVSIDDVLRTADGDTICLEDGFDAVCVKAIPGRDGKDGRDGQDGESIVGPPGKDGKDGTTYIAVKEVPIEVLVERIVKVVVVEREIVEVPVIVERVVEVIKVERETVEVPVEVFVTQVVEVIKEVYITEIVEVPVVQIREVPVEVIVKEIETVYRDKIVYRDPPPPEPPVIVEDKVYDSQDYLDWVANGRPAGQHEHTFTHTHNGKRHGHRIAHPDGQADNWDREHDGYGGITHE